MSVEPNHPTPSADDTRIWAATRRKILLVEDNPMDALLLRQMLAQVPNQPYEVECATTLADGLQRLGAGGFQLVLLDLSLPDSQGLETCARICAAAPHLPIVVLTGTEDEALSIEAVRHGAQDYLFKPRADAYWLERALRYALERKRSERRLRDFAAKLEQSNRALQDFAFVASHDLQAPLEKVRAFASRLEEECAGGLSERGQDYLRRLCNATLRMQQLIEGLLAYSRVNTQAKPFTVLDLDVLAQEVVGDLETRIEQLGGRVEIGPLGTVEGDPTQLRQLLQNLIGNGLKFHRPDVAPLIKVRGRRIEGTSFGVSGRSAFRLELTVEDNGIGFDEKYLGRLFVMFQRLHRPDQYEGTGIGLAVCRRIVERHGGSITARSQLGCGSAFIVTLPVQQPRGETTL